MRSERFPRSSLPLLTAGALLLPLGVGAGATGAVGAPDQDPQSAPAADPLEPAATAANLTDSDEVTLITGDELDVRTFADGRLAVSIDPAEREGGETPEFHRVEVDDELHVIPGDARPLISAGTLDRELFNVTELTESGLGDGHGEVPLIVTYSDQRSDPKKMAPSAPDITAAEDVVPLESIGGTAFSVDADSATDFWSGVTANSGSSMSSLVMNPSIEKIWLDGVVEVALEDSVPQINAPDAWDAGYDGTGTSVAILDTGIDDTHPDLAGTVAAAQGFTDENTTADGHGHGTHVAATVAGSGEGSDGLRPGVAPGADLLNAKVMNDGGSGSTSDIIAGMEWAVDEGADVVNMSLGSSPTDGTDPLSEAVNSLTESSGALFVIASGNDGRDHYVSAPGAASRALTVGAVDDDGDLAYFSNEGPRLGDYTIKPDITAPGMGIIAARAEGTSMGNPVDDLYTSANGTSMATPHVAGAAAILAERTPDHSADELKEALVSSAVPNPDNTVYEQGGGQVDAGRAATSTITASPAPLDLGYFTWPYEDAQPVTETVTLSNTSDTDSTFQLDLAMQTEDGSAAPDGMVTLSAQQVTVPAAGTVEVDVTVDPRMGDYSLYSGYLTGTTADETVVSVPVGFYKEDERVTLEVEGIARDGDQATLNSFVDVTNVDDIEQFASLSTEFLGGTASLRVPPGTYSVMGGLYTYDDESAEDPNTTQFAFVGDSEVEVTEDTTLVLDARDANPVDVDVQTHDVAHPQDGLPNVTAAFMRRDLNGVPASHSVGSPDLPLFAAPTEPVTEGEFEFSTRHILADPEEGVGGSFLFDAEYVERGAIPEDLSYVVDEAALDEQFAQVENDFHANAERVSYAEFRHHWRPHQRGSLAFARHFYAPLERTDFVSATDSQWGHDVLQTDELHGGEIARMFGPDRIYDGGATVSPTWYKGPFHPTFRDGAVEGVSVLPSVRDGDVLDLLIYSLADAEPGHSSLAFYNDGFETAFRLYQGGELVAEDDTARGDFEVAPGAHEFRLELDTTSTSKWDFAQRSTATRTAWTVQSPATEGDESQVLPMLHVDYDVPLDLRNRLTKPGASWLDLHVRHQQGADAAQIEGLEVSYSTDEGQTWQESGVVQDRGDGDFRAKFQRHPHASGDVSIKVSAWDSDGNRIEQEVINAFGSGR